MRLWQRHIDYLKDNPEGYWFKRKLYGWGWTPATIPGWLVMLAAVAAILWFAFRLDEKSKDIDLFIELALPIGLITLLLIVICYKTGEPPRWQWGVPEEDDSDTDINIGQ